MGSKVQVTSNQIAGVDVVGSRTTPTTFRETRFRTSSPAKNDFPPSSPKWLPPGNLSNTPTPRKPGLLPQIRATIKKSRRWQRFPRTSLLRQHRSVVIAAPCCHHVIVLLSSFCCQRIDAAHNRASAATQPIPPIPTNQNPHNIFCLRVWYHFIFITQRRITQRVCPLSVNLPQNAQELPPRP